MSNKYECEQCGKRCKNEKQLDLHILQHKSVELISCTESECSEEIVQKFLKDHLKNVHNVEIDQATTSWVQGNVKEFQCEDCGRQCKDQKHYDNHKYYHKRHHPGKTKIKSVKNKVKSEDFDIKFQNSNQNAIEKRLQDFTALELKSEYARLQRRR